MSLVPTLRRVVSQAVVLGVALASAWPAAADVGTAMEGTDRARILPPAGALTEPYRGVGYALAIDATGEVTVEVDVSPLSSRSRFEPPPVDESWREDPIARVARSITTGAGSHYEATSRILGWVSRHIEYELDRDASQDAVTVLDRRSAYCTGIARLTVAMLEAVGLEAREVAGYVVGDGGLGPQGFHRWIETRLPDVGWVMSDPLVSHHYVPATYVRLGSETVTPSDGMEGLLLERRDTLTPVDLYPAAPPGVRARRNTDRRLAAALRIAVDQGGVGLAVLEGRAIRFRRSLVDGETTFVGLEPGAYRLQLFLAGHELVERQVELVGRQRTTLYLDTVQRQSSRRDTDRAAPSHGTPQRLVTAPPGDRSEE
ncbi:MAG: transglutaminase-like domain-containing protein [Acidobacteriota bacterium]